MQEHTEEKFIQQEQAHQAGSTFYRMVLGILAGGVLLSLVAALAAIVIVVTILLRV